MLKCSVSCISTWSLHHKYGNAEICWQIPEIQYTQDSSSYLKDARSIMCAIVYFQCNLLHHSNLYIPTVPININRNDLFLNKRQFKYFMKFIVHYCNSFVLCCSIVVFCVPRAVSPYHIL